MPCFVPFTVYPLDHAFPRYPVASGLHVDTVLLLDSSFGSKGTIIPASQ
jgi:hypothetical protein